MTTAGGSEREPTLFLVAPPERARRPSDALFDTLTEFFGNPRMDSERSMFGKVVAELLRGGATAEETRIVCEYVLANFDSPSVNAVCKWYVRANSAPKVKRSAQEQALEQLRRTT